MKKNLVLLGMMAVGKTTLGKMIAKKLGYDLTGHRLELYGKKK